MKIYPQTATSNTSYQKVMFSMIYGWQGENFGISSIKFFSPTSALNLTI